jgi:prophage maintenance system killer protein
MGIAENHPFFDSNTRSAFVGYRLFLKWNGIELLAEKTSRYRFASRACFRS